MRKKFLIKPGLQLRHLFWTLGLVCVSCVIGYFVFETMVSSALIHHGLPLQDWEALRALLRTGFLVLLLILLGAIGVESYLLFHRFVGPIFALEKGLRKLADGDWEHETKIRDGDQLSDLIKSFSFMKNEMKARFDAQEKVAQLLSKELDRVLKESSKKDIIDLRNQLIEIRNQLGKKAA